MKDWWLNASLWLEEFRTTVLEIKNAVVVDWPSQKLQEGGGSKVLGKKGVVSEKGGIILKEGVGINPKKLSFWNSKCLKH